MCIAFPLCPEPFFFKTLDFSRGNMQENNKNFLQLHLDAKANIASCPVSVNAPRPSHPVSTSQKPTSSPSRGTRHWDAMWNATPTFSRVLQQGDVIGWTPNVVLITALLSY